jgi:hypothetical protein
MTSPVDRTNMVFYSCSSNLFLLSCTVSTIQAVLHSPKVVECRFQPLGDGWTGNYVTIRSVDPDSV